MQFPIFPGRTLRIFPEYINEITQTFKTNRVRYKTAPHDVYCKHLKELQTLLMDDDCFRPHFTREVSELCKNTALVLEDTEKHLLKESEGSLTSTVEMNRLKNGEDRANRIYNTENCGVPVMLGTKRTNVLKGLYFLIYLCYTWIMFFQYEI